MGGLIGGIFALEAQREAMERQEKLAKVNNSKPAEATTEIGKIDDAAKGRGAMQSRIFTAYNNTPMSTGKTTLGA